MEKFRKNKKDFIRNRKLSIAMNILLIFSYLKHSIQAGIDQFIIDIDAIFDTYSKQVFSKGRQRILSEAFKELHKISIEFIYKEQRFYYWNRSTFKINRKITKKSTNHSIFMIE